MFNNQKVVVTMTSWTKRIGNCVKVIQSILDNTVKPDIVFLNLSLEEFPNRLKDLPKDLVELTQKNPILKINWVDGPNTKTMKKVFPVLKYLDDDDVIIYIDDDILFPRKFIQSRLSDFENANYSYAISGNHPNSYVYKVCTDMIGVKYRAKSSSASLLTKRMLRGYDVFQNNEDVFNRAADDSLYTILCTLNGYEYIPCSDYCISGKKNCKHHLSPNFKSISPLSQSGVFKSSGYTQENVYITLCLYFTIVKNNPNIWSGENYERILNFNRIKSYEGYNFYSQSNQLNTIITHLTNNTMTYWYWRSNIPNAGDAYNKYLVEHIYDCNTKYVDTGSPDACFCGSILLNKHIRNTKYVVGCGLQRINMNDKVPNSVYLAIRGKITKNILKQNYNVCTNDDIVLCDPGLMISRIYSNSKIIQKKYRIGIIPHYIDEDMVMDKYGDKYHIISMKTDNIEALVDDIQSCDIIMSSSLHGIIFSHAFGIPAYHFQLSDLMNNGNFKFDDYYSSFANVEYTRFNCVNDEIPIQRILDYDLTNRIKSNPSSEMIMEKQEQFLSILPYRQYVNKRFFQQ